MIALRIHLFFKLQLCRSRHLQTDGQECWILQGQNMFEKLVGMVVSIHFVCLELIVPLENFSLIWKRHHCRWRGANFYLCSELLAIEQWGFFNVPHPLRHVYNGHLRGPVTLTLNAERLATPGNGAVTNCSVAAGIRTPNLPLAGRTLKPTAPPMQLNS